jgi:hypothetical protein
LTASARIRTSRCTHAEGKAGGECLDGCVSEKSADAFMLASAFGRATPVSRRVETALHLLCGDFRLQRRGRFEVGWQVRAGRHIARLLDDIFLEGTNSGEQLTFFFLWHLELIERLQGTRLRRDSSWLQ